jgi:hypothetical protein
MSYLFDLPGTGAELGRGTLAVCSSEPNELTLVGWESHLDMGDYLILTIRLGSKDVNRDHGVTRGPR